MKKISKPKVIITMLIILIIVYYLATLIVIKNQKFAKRIEKQSLATVNNLVQRSNQQYCTGTIVTPENTWLVSHEESDNLTYIKPNTSLYLNNLLPPQKSYSAMESYLGLKEDKKITYISKLNKNGKFDEVARLDGTACLVSPPDGKNILLLTDVNTQQDAIEEKHQFAVLRSDDQGRTWIWQKEGFFLPVYFQAWTFKPTFYNSQNTWLWKEDMENSVGEQTYLGLEAGKPSGLSFSPDLGKTTETIIASAPILINLEQIKTKFSENIEWQNEGTGEVNAFVTQWDHNQATLWTSQTYRYSKPKSDYIDGAVHTTSRANLRRINGRWELNNVKRLNGLAINKLVNNQKGQFIAIQSLDNQKQEQIAELVKSNLSWKVHGNLPQAFSPFNDFTSTQNMWITDNALIINTYSSHKFTRLLQPSTWFGSPNGSDISAFGTYSSSDLGKNWVRLSIKAPNGVLGVNQKTDDAYWAEGGWYDSRDLNIYKYQLK